MYLHGLPGMNTHKISKLHEPVFGQAVFRATMSKNCFKLLNKVLCLDDHTTRPVRWKNDNRFAAMREFFELFNINCSTYVIPGPYLALDETLCPMRTQIDFKQCNRSKSAKYGLLIKSINAAAYSDTFTAPPYCGNLKEKPTEHYVTRTKAIVKYLIKSFRRRWIYCGGIFLLIGYTLAYLWLNSYIVTIFLASEHCNLTAEAFQKKFWKWSKEKNFRLKAFGKRKATKMFWTFGQWNQKNPLDWKMY